MLASRIVAGAEQPLERFEFAQVHMGVTIKLALYAGDAASANRAAGEAFARFAQLDRTLSDYKSDSELSRLSSSAGSGESIRVGTDLWRVLTQGQRLAEATDGAFDVTVGPYVRLWRRARRNKQFPSEERLTEARSAVGFRRLKLDSQGQTARLAARGMQLDLGGIAMGYAADQALAVLRRSGFEHAMVDASGDIAVAQPPPETAGWLVAIAPLEPGEALPSRHVWLSNAALAVSGDAFQFIEIDGRRYSHIVDPRTGLGLTDHSQVTVIAADCMTADSLATAVSVLGPEKGLELIEQTPGAAALIVRNEGGRLRQYTSRRFADYERCPPAEEKLEAATPGP